MKGIYLVATLCMVTLVVATEESRIDISTECPIDLWNETFYLPHESDCTQFYKCYMGKKGDPLKCPLMNGNGNRFHFNPKLQICDWPWNTQCEEHISRPLAVRPMPSMPKLNSSMATVSAVPINPPLWTCKSDGRIYKIPHETMCDHYYNCYEGKVNPKPIKCERNLLFNPLLRVCDYPENVICFATTTQSTSTTSSTTIRPTPSRTTPTPTTLKTSTKTTPSTTISSPRTTIPPPTTKKTPIWTCESDGRVHKVPHETMCDHYYNCYEGKVNPKPIKCERDLLFNPYLLVCDYPENVMCLVTTPESTSTTSTTPSTITPTSPPTTSTTLTPTITTPSTSVPTMTPTLPPTTSTPSTITTASTTVTPTPPTSPPTTKKIPTLPTTPTSTLSTLPSTASTPTTVSMTPTLPPTTLTPSTITTASTTVTPTPPTSPPTTKKIPKPPLTCKSDGRIHKIPHETMCDHYYNCFAGKIYSKPIKCERNLLFNPLLRVCDYPENVICFATTSTFTTSSITSSTIRPTSPPITPTSSSTLPSTDTTSTTLTSSTILTSSTPVSTLSTSPPITLPPSSTPTATTPIITVSTTPTPPESTTKSTPPITLSTPSTLVSTHSTSPQTTPTPSSPSTATTPTLSNTVSTTPTPPESTTKSTPPTTISTSIPVPTSSLTTPTPPPSSSITTTFSPSTITTPSPTSPTIPSTTENPSNKPRKKCPPKGSSEKGRLAHPYQCHLYYECENGDAILKNCPIGQHFDYEREVCDWAAAVKCIRPIPLVHNIENDETNEDYQLELSLFSIDPTTCIGVCPDDDPDYMILLPNENCKKFCMCNNGMIWIQPCPGHLYFDSIDNICKQKKDATCAVRSTIQNPFPKVEKIEKIDRVKHLDTVNNNDNKICNKLGLQSSSYNLHPPAGAFKDDTEKINSRSSSGVSFDNLDPSTCIGTCPEEDPEYAVLLPNENCKKFCLCSNGIAWVQPCPEPLYFDSVEKVCKQKKDAVCGVRSFIGSLSVTDNKLSANGDSMEFLRMEENGIEKTDNKSPSGVSFDNLDPSTCIGTCPEEGPEYAVLLPNEDCKKFCLCSNGIAWVQPCPEPLYFDSVEKVCKQKKDAVCGVQSFIGSLSVTDNKLSANGDSMELLRMEENGFEKTNNKSPSLVYFYNLDPSSCIGTCPAVDPDYAVLLPNDDCKRFCLCSNGVAWVQSCPEPLYFDSVEKVCKWKKNAVCAVRPFIQNLPITEDKPIGNTNSIQFTNVKKSNRERREDTWSETSFYNLDPSTCIGTCPEEDPEYVVLLPNDDCKKFCMCSNGIAWVQPCPEPLYFDSIEKVCKQKKDAVCGVRLFIGSLSVTDNKLSTNGDSMELLRMKENGIEKTDNKSPSLVYFYNLDPSSCIGTCPAVGPDYAVLLPNDNCKRFCLCSNGVAWVQSCPEPLYFDSVEKVCKWKKDAVCAVRPFIQNLPITEDKPIENTNSIQFTNVKKSNRERREDTWSETSFYNLDPSTCIGTCPEEDPEYVVLLPNDDCKKFCMCSNGIAWVQPCPEPLYFDSVEKVCKQKKDAVCGVRLFIRSLSITDNKLSANGDSMELLRMKENGIEKTDKSPSRVSFDNLDPSTCIGTCPEEDPEYVVLLPNDDCKKFCMCSNGIAWVQPCPEPLYFDSVEKVCKQKKDAVCGVRSFIRSLSITDNKLSANGDSMELLRMKENGIEKTDKSPSRVSFDNLDPSTCIGTCPEEDPEYVVLLPNDDCKKFCMCSNGIAWVQPCPEPLYFDSVEKVCKQKKDAVCGVRSFIRSLSITDNKLSANGDSMELLRMKENGIEKTDKSPSRVSFDNLDPSTCIGTCPEEDPEYVVLLPNDDCKKFCMCSNGIAWVQPCPEPLYFDSVEKVCKQKKDAVCGVRSFIRSLSITDNKLSANGDSMEFLRMEENGIEKTESRSPSGVSFDNLDPSTCIGTCPEEDPEYAVLLPNEDCKKFCLCSNGIAWVQPCPEPLYFDSVEKVCKQKKDAVCGVRSFIRSLSITDNKLSANGDSMELLRMKENGIEKIDDKSPSGVSFDNLDPSTCIGTCPEEDPEYAVLLPNEDCKKFCLCSNGIAWVQPCPEPLYFDSVEKVCKQKKDAVCGERSFIRSLSITDNKQSANSDLMELLRMEGNGIEKTKSRSPSGVSFYNLDPSTCIGTCPEEDPEHAVLLPNEDCKKFCSCSNGIAWVQSCPEPLYFDSVEKVCKWKKDAVCAVRPFIQNQSITNDKSIANVN